MWLILLNSLFYYYLVVLRLFLLLLLRLEYRNVSLFFKEKQNTKTREEATIIANDILNNILDIVPNMKIQNGQLKKKRGPKVK